MLKTILRNSRGNAMIEIVPILAVFILMINFSFGFFGLIHSGILNSIAARNYAFETFRNRADLRYIRDVPDSDYTFTYTNNQSRLHAIKNESSPSNVDTKSFYATRRPIKFSEIRGVAEEKGNNEHSKYRQITEGKKVSDIADEGANPAWIRTGYGICLVANCGGT